MPVGHRQWTLRISPPTFGMGSVSNYTGLYLVDADCVDENIQHPDTFVAWPNSGDFPIQYFVNSEYTDTIPLVPWSVSLGAQYAYFSLDDERITLRRERDGKIWTFNKNTQYTQLCNYGDNDYMMFNADNGYYGLQKTLIFMPAWGSIGEIKHDDVFEVTVDGIRLVSGEPTQLKYSVKFFDLYNPKGWKRHLNRRPIRRLYRRLRCRRRRWGTR